MRRYFMAAALILVAALVLTGCGAKADPQQAPEQAAQVEEEQAESAAAEEEEAQPEPEDGEAPVGLANPVVEYESLEEINQAVGCKLVHPPVMGVEEKQFAVIGGTMAQYRFSAVGGEWTFRAAEAAEDISGYWVAEGTLTDLGEPETVIESDGVFYMYWFDGSMQYALLCEANGAVAADVFENAAQEMRALM